MLHQFVFDFHDFLNYCRIRDAHVSHAAAHQAAASDDGGGDDDDDDDDGDGGDDDGDGDDGLCLLQQQW